MTVVSAKRPYRSLDQMVGSTRRVYRIPGSAFDKVTTGTNFLGHLINTTFHSGGKLKIFPEVGDVFEEHLLKADRYVIKENKVLVNLAHVPDVRNHLESKLFRHQANQNKLIHSSYPCAVDLAELHRIGLHEILEQDCMGNVFAQCDGCR